MKRKKLLLTGLWPMTFMMLAACGRSHVAPPAQPVRIIVVESSEAHTGVHYSASVLPAAQVDLTFRVGGYVQAIRQVQSSGGRPRSIEAGDYIEAGAVLASLRPTDYQARSELSQGQLHEARSSQLTAEAQLEEATASLNQARMNFQRAQVLFDSRAMVKPDYDDAKSALDRAEAHAAAARAQINVQQARIEQATAATKEARSSLADVELRAPFAGVLVARNIERGSLAAPGTLAFVVADIRTVKVAFGIPDVALRSFRIGQVLPVTAEAVPGSVFRGHVSSISPSADSINRAYTVEVTVMNPERALKSGMIAAIQTEQGTPSESAPEVPFSAIVHTAGLNGYGVFVLESTGQGTVARLRPVVLGQVNGGQIIVRQGIAPGEHIIEDGGLQLVDGEAVREIR